MSKLKIRGKTNNRQTVSVIRRQKDDLVAVATLALKTFDGLSAPDHIERDFSFLSPFTPNIEEAIRFNEYIKRVGIKGLKLAQEVEPCINRKEKIQGFKKRYYLRTHFEKYKKAAGLLSCGRAFRSQREYSRAAEAIVNNPEAKKVMYYFRGKKATISYFIGTAQELLGVVVHNAQIKCFKSFNEKKFANTKVFDAAYRIY